MMKLPKSAAFFRRISRMFSLIFRSFSRFQSMILEQLVFLLIQSRIICPTDTYSQPNEEGICEINLTKKDFTLKLSSQGVSQEVCSDVDRLAALDCLIIQFHYFPFTNQVIFLLREGRCNIRDDDKIWKDFGIFRFYYRYFIMTALQANFRDYLSILQHLMKPTYSASLFVCLFAFFVLTVQLQLTPYDVSHSKRTAVYASLAYCSNTCLTSWSCKSASTLPGLTKVTYLSQSITQANGYVGYSSNLNTIIVSFRGSSNIPNWIENLNFEKAPYLFCLRCQIHTGFYADYLAIATQLVNTVQQLLKQYPNAKILTTGHSLGGALAMIAAVELRRQFTAPIEVHSFGAPRIGNVHLAKHVNNKLENIYRVVHHKDVVPHLPPDLPEFAYHHSAYEIFWNEDYTVYKTCGETGEDRSCSNQFFPEYNAGDHDIYFVKISSPQC